MKVSLLSIRSTQNTAKNKQAKNSLQHPDVPSATSHWFSGALLVDLFSKEQALRCILQSSDQYKMRLSFSETYLHLWWRKKPNERDYIAIPLVYEGVKSHSHSALTLQEAKLIQLFWILLFSTSLASLCPPHPIPLFRLSWQWALGWGCTLWPSVSG